MALKNVKFTEAPSGLGRLPDGKDHVSAIVIGVASPAGWVDPLGQKYLSVEEAEAHGIIEGDPVYGIAWYMIDEFFRVSGAATLYVVSSTHASFTAQNFFNLTGGDVRQAFWYSEANYAGLAAHVGVVKAFSDALETLFCPLVIVTNVKDEVIAVNGTAQVDVKALNAPTVAVLIAGDGTGKGKALSTALGVKYIVAGGTVLGALAAAQVHQHIGWVDKFNLSEGDELQRTVVSDGQDFNQVTPGVLDTLVKKGYMFFRKLVGISGTYVYDTPTATLDTSDYSTIENNRTMQKAKRGIRTALLPDLNSPLSVDDDGKLASDTIVYFENKVSRVLALMQNAGEISAFSVSIDDDQNVLATSKLLIQCRVVPRGVAREINVNIGYAISVA